MIDLVIQARDLPTAAVDAFGAAIPARRVQRRLNSARLQDVQNDAETRRVAQALGQYFRCDWAFVPATLRLADFRLLALDMDSTLINIESLDELAALAGKGPQVAAITEAAMRGEVADYAESLRRRVALLAGVEAALLERVYAERLRLNEGAETLLRTCRDAGLKTLLVTGGFTFFTERMRARLGFDFTRANELHIAGDRLTGEVTGPDGGPIVDAAGKAQALREACAAVGCTCTQAIVIGDGANDLGMMKLAGVSVAFRAKPLVRAQATYTLDYTPLSGVLALFADVP
ncbi:MAG: phosphoserine phosphatase SerB [Sutterellaceae bacterium]|nr:phosphoserine phosphatase SerB [Burkholderiaceae bacterium]MCX7901581.1 phosphoserine phosphatase SerB [Burkholderiaceae bacterium]MDW8430423.1 phosphoserine phosphatase SerB [Sutterellaceae bacterium]